MTSRHLTLRYPTSRRSRRRAAWSLVALLLAACNAHLDVLSPGSRDGHDAGGSAGGLGSGGADATNLLDATTPMDARPSPDAAAPRDATPRPPDAVAPPDHSVTELVVSYSDSCAIAAGTVYCWGLLPDGSMSLTPGRVQGAPSGSFRHVSGGVTAHCATRTTGLVYCWGTSDRGELGQGDHVARTTPARVALPGSTALVAGRFDSFCTRLDDGRLECWGQNDEGQMGQSDVGMAMDALSPVRVETASDWLDVATGQGHVCGIRAPGQLYCWGRNTDGELGQGMGAAIQLRAPTRVGDAEDWTTVVAGQGHTCGLRAGRLYCFGHGSDGQLGLSPRENTNVTTQVGDGTDWRSISTDTFHGCGLRDMGSLWCWGRNAEGQLGTGDVEDRDVPTRIGTDSDWAEVSVGRFHTCARRTDGTVWCTGANDHGELGTGDMDRRSVFTELSWGD